MPNNDLFSDIPALGDDQGLENLLNQQALSDMGISGNVPSALETQQQEPAQDPTPTSPTYTNEQIQQIIARNQQLEAQLGAGQQQQPQVQQQQPQPQPQRPTGYNPRQIEIINKLLASGMTIGQINDELNKRRAVTSNSAMLQRVQALEQQMQQQAYEAAANEFEQKMLTFGEKFGLSENELVYFGEKALTKGFNVSDPRIDPETVFRAIEPEQYALRMQRINNNSSSQIYGGVAHSEVPRAQASKMEDAYVDSFLRGSMPNQYNMYHKK